MKSLTGQAQLGKYLIYTHRIVAIVFKLPYSIFQCSKVPHISYGHWLSSRRKPKLITLLDLNPQLIVSIKTTEVFYESILS